MEVEHAGKKCSRVVAVKVARPRVPSSSARLGPGGSNVIMRRCEWSKAGTVVISCHFCQNDAMRALGESESGEVVISYHFSANEAVRVVGEGGKVVLLSRFWQTWAMRAVGDGGEVVPFCLFGKMTR